MRFFVVGIIALVGFGLFSSAAEAGGAAQMVVLNNRAADEFIAKHFPQAEIPGAVQGKFEYQWQGQTLHGAAACSVPAMGARGDGAVDTCTVTYSD